MKGSTEVQDEQFLPGWNVPLDLGGTQDGCWVHCSCSGLVSGWAGSNPLLPKAVPKAAGWDFSLPLLHGPALGIFLSHIIYKTRGL